MYKSKEIGSPGIKTPETDNVENAITSARVSVSIRHEIIFGGGLMLDSQMAGIAAAFQSDEELHRAIRARGRIRLQSARE